MSTVTKQAERHHACCTVGTGRDRISMGTGARPYGRQRGVVTGNDSTRLATGVVIKRKPTWNVRTMTTDGKAGTVERELVKINISCLGLSEVRWTGKGHFMSYKKSMVIYDGSERKHESGVEMILDKQTWVSMPVTTRSQNVCWLSDSLLNRGM